MKLLLPALLFFLSGKLIAQSCPVNIDFEQGDFTNWQCFIGKTSSPGGQNVINLHKSKPMQNRHEIISADSNGVIPIDGYGKFPKLCPYGGKYSVKLGNEDVGAEAEGISYTFTVPSSEDTFSFTYFYAVVFEDPQHPPSDQPRFFVTAYETATGNLINCASYNYVSTSRLPGFKRAPGGGDVWYKEWSPVSIQFAGLANKEVTLEFKTADCTQGGHFGYAYLDVGSGCSNILATAPYCKETNSLLLNAPYGFQYYTWYNESFTQVLGHDQNLKLSPPPVTSGKFWVDIVPYPDYGCRDTVYALVTPLPVPDTPVAKTRYFFCQNVFAPPFEGSPAKNCDLLWYTDTTKSGTTEPIIPSTKKPGIFYYYVSQKLLFGCESFKKKITVQIDPTPVTSFTLNTNKACQKNNLFKCLSTSGNLQDPSYEWDFGNGFVVKDTDKVIYSYPDFGAFTITLKITNGPVCNTTSSANITVVPKPIAAFDHPPVICQNQTQVTFTDQSTVPQQLSTIVKWRWLINGNAAASKNPPGFVPVSGGDLPVSLAVTTGEGCVSDTLKTVLKIHYQPKALFVLDSPLCDNKNIRFTDKSFLPLAAANEVVNKWQWFMDNTSVSSQNPAYLYSQGYHHTSLIAQSNYGCNSLSFDSTLLIYQQPYTAININDSCVYRKIIYTAQDLAGTVVNWYWNFGESLHEDKPVLSRYFLQDGDNSFTLMGKTIHGCIDTIIRPFKIYMNRAFAGRDTLAAYTQPVQLDAHGGTDNHYTWTPSTGLSNAYIENPVALYDQDMLYRLDAITNEGCDAHSKILIKRFKGPDIYIPTAFTPNNDRLNDILRAFAVGMKKLGYFSVYDEYGNQVFYTSDFTKGWDGNIRNMPAKSGTYVAVAQATDYTGKNVVKKVAVVLIR